MSRLARLLALHEGKRLERHMVNGIPHVGIGHNLAARPLPWLAGRQRITKEECARVFADDVADAERDLDRYLPWWRGLDEARQAVLVDLCFNLGIGWPSSPGKPGKGLRNWTHTLSLVQAGQWAAAGAAMTQNSVWAKQVGQRATRLARMMVTGEWPPEVQG